ncbi:hypothetical protein BH23GEM11_BH23GEM11_05210 [soil metagenome]
MNQDVGSLYGVRCRPWFGTARTYLLLSVAALLLSPAGVRAQIGNPSASAGISFETYRFSDEENAGLRSIFLTTLPFSAEADVTSTLRLQVRGALSAGQIDRADGSTASLRGFTDTELQVEARTGQDRLRIAGIVMVPTGHSRYSMDEAEVAGIMTADVLPFRMTNWGSGGGLGVRSLLAGTLGTTNVGLSTSFFVGREFEVFANEDAMFRPGNQFSIGVVANQDVGRAGRAGVQLQMTQYGDDELAGSNLYRSGRRFQALGSYAFAAPRYSSAIVYAGVTHRSNGTFLALPDLVASQNLFVAGAVMRMSFDWGVLVPSLELQALQRSDGTGQGYTTSVGGTAERVVGRMVVGPSARIRFGQVVVFEEARSGFVGLEVGLTTRFGRAGT